MDTTEQTGIVFDEHLVSVFLSYEVSDGGKVNSTFADLVSEASSGSHTAEQFDRTSPEPVNVWLPERLRLACSTRYAQEAIFEKRTAKRAGDLYLPVQRLLSGSSPDHCTTFGLTERALSLLNKGQLYDSDTPPDERYGHRLAFKLSKPALRRLEASMPPGSELPGSEALGEKEIERILPVTIEECHVYHFSTGRIVCRLSLKVSDRDAPTMNGTLLAELADHMGRFATLVWLETAPSAPDAKAPAARVLVPEDFTIGSLIARLLHGEKAISQSSHRAYTHVYGLVAENTPSLSKQRLALLAERLARQYTDDYALTVGVTHGEVVSDFDNIVHVASREGAATLVDPRTKGIAIPILKDFQNGPLFQSYLPLIVLNIHQLSQALSLNARTVLDTSGMRSLQDNGHSDDSVEVWEKLRRDALRLRNHFCFHTVSQVTMHNDWNKALRKVLELDVAEMRLSRDIAEMSERVEIAAQKNTELRRASFERRFGWISKIAAGLGLALVAVEGVMVYHTFRQGGFDTFEFGSLLLLLALVVVGLIGGIWSYFSTR